MKLSYFEEKGIEEIVQYMILSGGDNSDEEIMKELHEGRDQEKDYRSSSLLDAYSFYFSSQINNYLYEKRFSLLVVYNNHDMKNIFPMSFLNGVRVPHEKNLSFDRLLMNYTKFSVTNVTDFPSSNYINLPEEHTQTINQAIDNNKKQEESNFDLVRDLISRSNLRKYGFKITGNSTTKHYDLLVYSDKYSKELLQSIPLLHTKYEEEATVEPQLSPDKIEKSKHFGEIFDVENVVVKDLSTQIAKAIDHEFFNDLINEHEKDRIERFEDIQDAILSFEDEIRIQEIVSEYNLNINSKAVVEARLKEEFPECDFKLDISTRNSTYPEAIIWIEDAHTAKHIGWIKHIPVSIAERSLTKVADFYQKKVLELSDSEINTIKAFITSHILFEPMEYSLRLFTKTQLNLLLPDYEFELIFDEDSGAAKIIVRDASDKCCTLFISNETIPTNKSNSLVEVSLSDVMRIIKTYNQTVPEFNKIYYDPDTKRITTL